MSDGHPDPLVARLRRAGCVWAEEEAAILRASAKNAPELMILTERRCAGEPLEYVVGWAELCGIRVSVTRGVFIPRRRSELLARSAARLAQPGDVVVDLACGSGVIGAVVASLVPGVSLHAADVSPTAVEAARGNLAAWGAPVYTGDLFDALPDHLRGSVAVLVANVPYVPTSALSTLPGEARDHEPRHTLDGGVDGLDLARQLVAQAAPWLRPGGSVLVECTGVQSDRLAEWAEHHDLSPRVLEDRELDAFVVVATAGGTRRRAAP